MGNKERRGFRADVLILAGVLLLAALLYLAGALPGGGETWVVVRIGGEERLRCPLSVDGTYPVSQEDGSINVITVSGGSVWMSEANCRDGLCMHQGKIRNRARSLVCLPHSLVVSLEGKGASPEEDEVDVILY